MGFEYTISRGERLACVTALGPIDFEQSLAVGDELAADPEFEPGFKLLVDLRRMEFNPSTPEIESFARTLPRFKQVFSDRIAVATSGGVHFGLARMTCLMAEAGGFLMRAFSDYEAARAWLVEDAPRIV